MKRLLRCGLIGSFFFCQASIAQSAYVCVADMAVGFRFDKSSNSWRHANFNTKGQKFLLAKNSSGSWEWTRFGEKFSLVSCEKDFNPDYMHCGGMEQVVMNRTNLRFQIYYSFGYLGWKSGGEGGDTPSITIGTCASLD